MFLDIRFRMLQWHELAGAQGFPRGYVFTGNKKAKVKQIGNAVPPIMAKALAETMMIALRGMAEQDDHVSRRTAAAV